MFLRKRRSCEYRHCTVWQEPQSFWIATRCLDKSSIKTSWASLPAKQTITVGASSGFNMKLLHDWSDFDLPKRMTEEHICLMPPSCLSLIKYTPGYKPISYSLRLSQSKFADASVLRNEQKGVLIVGVPYPLSQSLFRFPFLPILSRCLLRGLWHMWSSTFELGINYQNTAWIKLNTA